MGIRYVPCKAASDSLFLPCNNRKLHATDTSARLRGPEGPQYWYASSSQSSADHAIYTFFPHAVTPTPQYDFPATKSATRQRVYSDASIDLVSSPPTVTQTFRSGNEDGFYADDDERNGVPEWDRLGEEHDVMEFVPLNYFNEEVREIANVPSPEMILDRFSPTSPVPFSETADEYVSAVPANLGSWGFPPEHLQHQTQSVIAPTSGIAFRSPNAGIDQPHQYESFYQQQVLGALEREREVEEIDRSSNDGNVMGVRWGFDPDGESEVWGVLDAEPSWAADPYDSESTNKSTEGFSLPER